jgi:hypothetical protein
VSAISASHESLEDGSDLPSECAFGRREQKRETIRITRNLPPKLKSIEYQIIHVESGIDGRCGYWKTINMSYETETAQDIQDYAFVQYIRGCVFHVATEPEPYRGFFRREHMNDDFKLFHHPEWTADTFTHDPIYWASPQSTGSRHGYYRLPEPNFNPHDASLYQDHPNTTRLWATDSPTGGGSNSNTYGYSSMLEFSTCLYPTADIPRSVADGEILLTEPVHCLDWSQKRSFQPGQGYFKTSGSVTEICSAVAQGRPF